MEVESLQKYHSLTDECEVYCIAIGETSLDLRSRLLLTLVTQLCAQTESSNGSDDGAGQIQKCTEFGNW